MQQIGRAQPLQSPTPAKPSPTSAGSLGHCVPSSRSRCRAFTSSQQPPQQHARRTVRAHANKVKRAPAPIEPSESGRQRSTHEQQSEEQNEQHSEHDQQHTAHDEQHSETADGPMTGSMDVSGLLINPVFRSTPWEAEREEQGSDRKQARIVFVGESNVCRSVLAQTIFGNLLEAEPRMKELLLFESKATRDYNIGEGPEMSVQTAAQELGLTLPEGITARLFNHERDIVAYDLVLVMDKFTAADVMREVSSYDLVNKTGFYTLKVRRLGDFHPVLGQTREPDGQDINDPLYGNMGGDEEKEAVKASAALITECCQGLLQFLREVADEAAAEPQGSSFRELLSARIRSMDTIAWLVPSMLSGRR